MTLGEIVKHPLISSTMLTSLFVVSFAIGPYHSQTGLTVLFLGITIMLLWVNLTGVINLISMFAAEVMQLKNLIRKVNSVRDSAALTRIIARAAEKKISPGVSSHAKIFYQQLHEHLRVHRYASLEVLGRHFETLEQHNLLLQARHRSITLAGSLATLAGFAVQMTAQFRHGETGMTLERWGSGTFAIGFAAAAFYHLYVASQITHHHSQANLMEKALREEYELFLFSKIPAASLGIADSSSAADEFTIEEEEMAELGRPLLIQKSQGV